ncbi:MAG: SpoIIE family protein phosphatase [Verrucomicrobia bacterium]|jgi:sigma-B regulation protein RsbU (phosphoserine phosphatase)|nr:SpoIIE family protein phosphatase [Verrucomicrobiota bacterium]OQC67882.1 MAG: Phosphoserine phosphatase RsbU [Verrucomicrobia bacterium ADurb.Bin006]MDI9382427.1 SpoIIE family protein phosphatase [Verrucomicrobiota bacterium]HNV00212.1 SpoIIE family protein phosphatase [Verrucomicrobiota bacterium]HOA61118.1 SpoIIE family protein phosphatase [Verrucomicrobiota bacterium]
MKKPLRALIIEDSEFDAVLLVNHLRLGQYDVAWRRVDTAEAMSRALAEQPWDIVFSDHQMPQFSAPEALELLQRTGLDLPFIIVSGGIGEATAVALMKAGAHDFLTKGQLGRLVPATERELRDAANRAARRQAEQQMRENEMRYRLLWHYSPDAILMADSAGTIGFVNPAVQSVFGYTPEELLGQPVSLLLGAEANPPAPAEPEVADTDPDQAPMRESVCRHKDGHQITVEVGFSALEWQGRSWRVAFMRDITARCHAERALRARDEEFRVAREIQRRLFPEQPPVIPGYDIAGSSFPADEAGGDYFDYIEMPEAGLGIVVGDVAGHGMGPALIMAETRAYLRIVAFNHQRPCEALTRANRVLADDLGQSDRFVTVFFARIDAATRTLLYSSAGHPAAYLLDASGGLKRRLARTGPALGLDEDTRYQDAPGVTLDAGDLLVVLTDGVTEAVDAQGNLFGADRVLEVVRSHQHLPAQVIVKALCAATRAFADGGRQTDDVTVLVVKALADSVVDGRPTAS